MIMKRSIAIFVCFLFTSALLYGQDLTGKWELQSVELKKVDELGKETAEDFQKGMFNEQHSGIFEVLTFNANKCTDRKSVV